MHRGEPLDDLVQVASVALVKSVDRFDPSRGVDFAAFATRTIIGELKRHFRDKGWAVRASRRVQELYLELGHATGTLVQQLGRNPTVAELAEATGASEEAVIEAIEAGQGYRAASIDASESEDDPLSARLGEEDGNFHSVEDRALLGPALATLPEREQSILRMRFVEGLTQSEIATAVGVSQMHVSRLLSSMPAEAARGHRSGRSRTPLTQRRYRASNALWASKPWGAWNSGSVMSGIFQKAWRNSARREYGAGQSCGNDAPVLERTERPWSISMLHWRKKRTLVTRA